MGIPPCTCQPRPLLATHSLLCHTSAQLPDDLLARLRAYLQLARSLDVKMSDEFCKIAEEKFVSARQVCPCPCPCPSSPPLVLSALLPPPSTAHALLFVPCQSPAPVALLLPWSD
eukprot:756796-Hanusia_phi.AAC.1